MAGTDRVVRSSGPEPGGVPRLGYQPALDGVRAIAIALVIAFHYQPNGGSWLASGHLGVDAFFVLSGFLITSLLLEERAREHRIALRHFYVRRALRLLPLLFALVAFGVVAHLAVAPSFEGYPETRGILSVLFYYANFMHQWHPSSLGMLGHAWSLAVEEQFYLVWPPVLAALLALRVRRPMLAVLTGGSFVAIALYRWVHWDHIARSIPAIDALRAYNVSYFGSISRGSAILLGCCLAITLPYLRRLFAGRRFALGFVGWCGLAFGTWIVWHASNADVWFTAQIGFAGFAIGTAAVMTCLVLAPGGALATVFKHPLMVWIGRRSYGIYVIHYPVFVLLSPPHAHLGWLLLPVELAVTLALAALSFRYLERPILRHAGRFRGGRGSERAR